MRYAALLFAAGVAALAQNSQPSPVAPGSAGPTTQAAAAQSGTETAGENNVSGTLEFGYRWVTDVGGNFNTWRSIVDLGSGPKLLGTDFTILNPSKRLFDRAEVRAHNWGDDPYSTAWLSLSRSGVYLFTGDYRNIAYYSNLPAFADPTAATGRFLNQQALDTRKRLGSYRLELLPGRRIMPYLEYEHTADYGNGVAVFIDSPNEYPVVTLARTSGENYRAGARLEFKRFHGKVEQGGLTFKDDQQLNQSGRNSGNFLSPVFAQTLSLTSLSQAYGVRGHGVYTDASFTANPVPWADVYANFLYSQPASDVRFQVADAGNQILLSQVLFYTSERNLLTSYAKMPHTAASLGAEIRPFSRLRLIPSWLTDRMHTTGSAAGAQTLALAAGSLSIASALNSRLVNNSSQAEMNAILDVGRRLTLRGGYRYEWGDASDVTLPAGGLTGFEQGRFRRNVVLAGAALHPAQNASINIDFENGSSGQSYFRTSLYNYQKARIRGRHRITPSLSVSAAYSVLNNQNPSPGIHYDFLASQQAASVTFTPAGGKVWGFEGGYTHTNLRSDIAYLDPAFLTSNRSLYRDNSHTVSALFDFNLPSGLPWKTRLSAGGSALLSAGSNPTDFYQPLVRVDVAVRHNAAWVTEWRYYGFAETFYGYQNFRTSAVTTGIRISR